jgi:L-galactose dehydrogenase
MEYRRLGRTGLRVSKLGLGTGGASMLGQQQGLDQTAVTALVRRALDLGVNLIDTAPIYRQSERLLGSALAGVPRESYLLATKFWPNRSGPLQPTGALRASVERSLRRLKTDYLDLLYLHSVEAARWRLTVDWFQAELEQLRRDGLVRYLGMSEAFHVDHQHRTARAVIPLGLFEVVMIGYNLLSPAASQQVFPLARAHDVGVVVMCAARGALRRPERIREIVQGWKQERLLARDAVPDDDPLGWVLGPWADSLTAAGYKFAAADPAVSCVLAGTGRIAHLEQNVEAVLGPPLPPAIVQRLIDLFGPVSRCVNY